MAEAAWREALRRMRRPPGSGMGGAEGRALRRFGFLVPVANFVGALDVFVFLFYVLGPSLPTVDDPGHVRMVNELAFAIYMPASMVVAGFLSTLVALPTFHWLESRRSLDAPELARILQQPAKQVKVSAVMWLLGALVFGIFNARYSVALGALVAVTVILGGATTCAVI